MDTSVSLFLVIVMCLPHVCIKEPQTSLDIDLLVSGAALSMQVEEGLHDTGGIPFGTV